LYCFQASEQKYFSSLHHWLLLPVSGDTFMPNYDGDGPALWDDPLITALEQLDLPLDCHVTVARPGHNRLLLQDVYRLVKGQPVTVTSARDWSPAESFPVGPRRDNYKGIVFPAATVASITTIIITVKQLGSGGGLTRFGLSCQFLLRSALDTFSNLAAVLDH
jgi:hypothetical protein